MLQAELAIAEIIKHTNTHRPREVIDLLADTMMGYPITPIATFHVNVGGHTRSLALKLEGHSPWRSIKGRTAIGLIASAAPLMTDRSRLVESTSGNLGVAMAGLLRKLGIPFTAVVDDRLPAQMRQLMNADGAELVPVDMTSTRSDPLARRIETAARIQASDRNTVWTNQYENLANPLIHELWTGPELLDQTPDVQAVFIGASTGGTLAGVSRAVRSSSLDIKVVGVDVEGSTVFGGRPGPRAMTGIGASRKSTHITLQTCDSVEIASSLAGIVQCRKWREMTGLSLGGSSGVVLAAALRHLHANKDLTRVACICPDLGECYAETIFNDAWVERQRATLRITPPSPADALPEIELIGTPRAPAP